MRENKHTGEKNCESRDELAQRYFDTFGDGIKSVYAEGNMGIITLLSDLQHQMEIGFSPEQKEYWRVILNDIKCILIKEDREEAENGKESEPS
jgi:hypothetical protein